LKEERNKRRAVNQAQRAQHNPSRYQPVHRALPGAEQPEECVLHGDAGILEQNPHSYTQSDIGEVGFFLGKNPV
jgi:hypothetical protein